MKKIKAVVLKDATTLTNSEMKSIRGGYEPERSAVCSMVCPVEYGGSSITADCTNWGYCDVYTGSEFVGLACYTNNGDHYPNEDDQVCERPVEG